MNDKEKMNIIIKNLLSPELDQKTIDFREAEYREIMDKLPEPKDISAMDRQVGGDHYKKYKIQPIDFFYENEIPPVESGIIKYVLRHRDKNGKEDLLKAIHCIEYIMEKEYGN